MGLFGFNKKQVYKTAKKTYKISRKTYKVAKKTYNTAKRGNNIFWNEWDTAFNVKPQRQTKSKSVFHSTNSIWDDDIH